LNYNGFTCSPRQAPTRISYNRTSQLWNLLDLLLVPSSSSHSFSSNIAHCRFHFSAQRRSQPKLPSAISMASSLVAKRFLSSSLLSKSLLRPVANASRSFNTNAMRNYEDQNVDVERRSERSFPRTARRDDIFSGSCSHAP